MQCHLVTRFGENYTCDKRCIGFARRKICAHTVGASIYCGHLKEFLSYYTKNVFQEVTVTELTNTNAQAGKKFGAQRKRKSISSDIFHVSHVYSVSLKFHSKLLLIITISNPSLQTSRAKFVSK